MKLVTMKYQHKAQDLTWKYSHICQFVINYKFCPREFAEMVLSISVKLSDLIDIGRKPIGLFLYWWLHFRFRNIDVLAFFGGWFVHKTPTLQINWVQIFRDGKQKIVDVYNANHICLIKKAPKSAWTWKLSLKKVFSLFISFL